MLLKLSQVITMDIEMAALAAAAAEEIMEGVMATAISITITQVLVLIGGKIKRHKLF